MSHKNKLGVSATNNQIIKLAAPISLSLLIPQINFFTNTVFLGRLGERELGVNGITGVFYLILSMIGYGLSSGIQIQMARRAGEGEKEALAKLFANGLMLAVMFALGLMLLALWVVPLLFGYSLNDPENYELSVQFIYVRVWGLPFLILTQVLSSFFIAVSRSRMLIYGSVAATLVNVLLDYALIFGKGGMPAMGYMGAAIASVAAELAACVVLAAAFFAKGMHRTYLQRRDMHFDPYLSVRTLTVAAPLIVQFMFSIGGWLVFFVFIEHLGQMSLAASQLLRNVLGLVSVGTWALATTCNTMVSNLIGQGRQKDVVPVILRICKISLLYAAGFCLLMLVFSREFLALCTNDAQLIEFAIPSMRVIVVATLIMSLSTVVFNGVVGTGNTLVNLSIEVACVGSYLVYCFVVIRQLQSPLYICWGSEFVYWTSLLLASSLYLKSGRWKGKTI